MGVCHAAFESVYQMYVSEEPPLYLHGMVMSVLDPHIQESS